MAITFVGSGTIVNDGSQAGTTGISLDVHADTLEDDLLFVVQHRNDNAGTFDAITDWTLVTQHSTGQGTDQATAIYLRFAASDAPGATTFTHSDSNNEQWGGVCLTYRGVDLTTPLDVAFIEALFARADNVASPNSNACPPITTVTDGAFVILMNFITGSVVTSDADPSGYTNRANLRVSATHRNLQVWDNEIVTAGLETPGAAAFTVSNGNQEMHLYTIALRPASGAGPQTIAVGQVTENETLFGPTVVFNQSISVGQLTENETLFSPAVIFDQSIPVGQINETESLFSPAVSTIVSQSVGLLTENESLFGLAVIFDQSILVGLLTENELLFSPAVIPGGISAAVGLLTENESLFSPAVAQGVIVGVGLLTENELLFSATPVPGGISVAVGLLTENESLFATAVVQGAIVAVGLLTENESLFAATPVPGGISAAVGQLTENESLFSPAVIFDQSIAVGLLTENESLFSPIVGQGSIVSVGLLTENESLFATAVIFDQSIAVGQILENESLFPALVIGGDVGAIDAGMADPRTPGRETRRKRRAKHPAWHEMEIRLKREYEGSLSRQQEAVELKAEPPGDYLEDLIDQHDQVQDDIEAIEARITELNNSRVADAETRAIIQADIKSAQFYLDQAQQREITQARLIAAIEAVIMYYYY